MPSFIRWNGGILPNRDLTIAALSVGRDNNLNLIRLLAAICVLVSHAFPITLGTGTPEPFADVIGLKLGEIAVAVFFVISGFLITRSYATTPDPAAFLAARALRLIPALLVVLILTALILGPLTTDRSFPTYLADPAVGGYIAGNASLAFVRYTLPGVFEANPNAGVVNGSLWTLFHEAACYVAVLAFGLAGALRSRPRAMVLVVGTGAAIVLVLASAQHLPLKLVTLATLAIPFLIGGLFYAGRAAVPLRWDGLAVLIAATILSHGTPPFLAVFVVTLAYATLILAFRARWRGRALTLKDDLSYGVYLYAYPVQQTVAWAAAPASVPLAIALALPATLVFATLSWVLVEKPALEAKQVFAQLLGKAWRTVVKPAWRMRQLPQLFNPRTPGS